MSSRLVPFCGAVEVAGSPAAVRTLVRERRVVPRRGWRGFLFDRDELLRAMVEWRREQATAAREGIILAERTPGHASAAVNDRLRAAAVLRRDRATGDTK